MIQRMTSHINQLVNTIQTQHQETIATVMSVPERDVKRITSQLEPWTELDADDTTELDVVTGHQGIPRIKRDKIDGLGRLEQQAETVVCPFYLHWPATWDLRTDFRKRIMSLNRLDWVCYYVPNGERGDYLEEVCRSWWNWLILVISFTSTAIVLAGIIIWLLLWTFEWR